MQYYDDPYKCTDMRELAMATRSGRLETRLTEAQRMQIERAAALAGESLSAFVVAAALQRAEAVVDEQASTVVPAQYFDRLVEALDAPDEAPRLSRAAKAARRRRRIQAA